MSFSHSEQLFNVLLSKRTPHTAKHQHWQITLSQVIEMIERNATVIWCKRTQLRTRHATPSNKYFRHKLVFYIHSKIDFNQKTELT